MIAGVQPFGFMYPPMLAVFDARWNVMGLPGAITSLEHMQRVHNESAEYQKLNNEFADKTGIKVFLWEFIIPYGDISFNTKRPLIKPSDWEGLKMRAAPTDLQKLAAGLDIFINLMIIVFAVAFTYQGIANVIATYDSGYSTLIEYVPLYWVWYLALPLGTVTLIFYASKNLANGIAKLRSLVMEGKYDTLGQEKKS